ncbi:T9SS type A sorting domain-containing protein [uncultured Polaribacter sp.]|uniref:T9SS type A sorting domain-containing protein n=1 Tax=uncultured Polaribacter sp. TaxID=174711 RepID=UPI0026058BDF|nr:T9SS type A sorting domain-containing protein [uncultured Polaribacter sp.]
MKKITLLLTLLITSIGFSQELITNGDFSNGATSWTSNHSNPPEIRTEGGNSFFFANVASALPSEQSWQVNLQQNITLVANTSYTVTFTAQSDTEGRLVRLGLGLNENPFTNDQRDIPMTTTLQTYTQVLRAPANITATNGRIFFDLAHSQGTISIDDISVVEAPAVADPEPTDAPDTPPTRNASDVISIYGDSYGTATGLNGVPWDEGAEAEEGTFAGNNALKITRGSFDFIGFNIGNAEGVVDATEMTNVHMDFWIAGDYVPGQVFKIKLSNHDKPDGSAGESSAIIKEVATAPTDAQTWVSLDLPLGADPRNKIKEVLIIYTNSATPPSTVYVDNIYLYREATASVENNLELGFAMFPNPANNVLNISAKGLISNVEMFNVLGRRVKSFTLNNTSDTLDISDLSSGIYLIRYQSAGKVGTAKFVKE